MRLRRTRWFAIGALASASVAGGGIMLLQATSSASSFVPVTPTRVLDTRINVGLTGPLVHDTARVLTVTGTIPTTPGGPLLVVPSGATAVVMNVTAVSPSAGGFVSIRPGDASGAPSTSSLNFSANTVVPNAVTVELPPAGTVNLYYFGSTGATTDLLIDIVGYYLVGAAGPDGADGAAGVSGTQYGRRVIYNVSIGSGADTGGQPSIAIGADGLPVIAHRDSSDGEGIPPDIWVTHCNDTACASSSTIEIEIDTGWDMAIAIGSDGLPIIAHSPTGGGVRVTHCNDLTCSSFNQTTFNALTITGFTPSIAIGADGLAIIAHRDSGGTLRVTHCDNIACTAATTTDVDAAADDAGRDPSITIGTDGLAVIAHQDGANDDLRVTHCSNLVCTAATTTALDTEGHVGFEPSIAIGIDGLPVVSHRDDTTDDLRVTRCTDVACTSATHSMADIHADSVGNFSSITIGPDGLPIIAHQNSSQTDLRMTYCADLGCTSAESFNVVNTSFGDGQNPSIAIGRDGNVVVAHRPSGFNGLRITKIMNMSWTENGWES